MVEKKIGGYVVIDIEECKGCGYCVDACPVKVLMQSDRFNRYGYHYAEYIGEGCTGCGICFYNCPEPGAITVFKNWSDIKEKAFCKNCNQEQLVFKKNEKSDILYCTKCLKPI
ncbi:MAG: 4Fe-4S dicluster domain-containing protein [Candidatus Marinimicrobia bacterium]|nr:4Fe-4S dicluster domain-containing protein [Candidatus Neomarinimicrobiota bacterium]